MAHVNNLVIYTDGACSGNPGSGGWGAVLICGDHQKEISGGEKDTTNNRMELMAVISALESLNKNCDVSIFTDSKYVMDGASKWIINWKKNGWKTANKKPVKNVDLWQRLDQAQINHKIIWNWVKGHSGNKLNEKADELAVNAIPK